jgi:Mitochondrial carrier protein
VSLGSISQTLTYPFDVLRRKMQVVGMKSGSMGYKYNGAFDALRVIVRTEGIPGLYRGLWPNLRTSSFHGFHIVIHLTFVFSQSQSFDCNIVLHLRAGQRHALNISRMILI